MRALTILLALSVAACGSDMTPEEKAQADAEAVREVEAASVPPPMPVVLQAMDFSDIEEADMFGVGCSFIADGGSSDPVVVALLDAAYVKIDREIERFAPDAGSAETAFGIKTKFDGTQRSMEWIMLEGEGEQVGMETVEHRATVRLTDGRGRAVYEQSGYAQCGS